MACSACKCRGWSKTVISMIEACSIAISEGDMSDGGSKRICLWQLGGHIQLIMPASFKPWLS
eukprot:843643-Pelagomonas_calceolata.AAC.3